MKSYAQYKKVNRGDAASGDVTRTSKQYGNTSRLKLGAVENWCADLKTAFLVPPKIRKYLSML